MNEFEYVPEGWSRRTRGWDAAGVERAYRRRWPEFVEAVRGNGTLGLAHEVPLGQSIVVDDPGWHNVVMTFGYVLARAAHGRRRLSVLDWGGGPGHYHVLAHALMPEVDVEYHSRDLPRLAALGRDVLPAATFHADDSCLDRTYDLVVVSDSLHYAEDWRAQLARLEQATGQWLFLALIPVVHDTAAYVVQQRPDSYGYDTEYLGWVLNRNELVGASKLRLEREFVAPGVIDPRGAPEAAVHRSFLFSA